MIITLVIFLGFQPAGGDIFHKPFSTNNVDYVVSRFDSTYPYDVLHYDIHVELDFPGNSILSAWTEITARAVDTLSYAEFNFVGLDVDSVLVNGVQANYDMLGTGVNTMLSVDLSETLNAGDTFTVAVSYHGTPAEGLYYNGFNGGLTYVMSIPWPGTDLPVGARYWFPCCDELNDKATSELWITIPEGYEVVGNGRLESMDVLGREWRYHWVEDYPIPTWYIAFAVSNYVVVRDSFVYGDSVMPITSYVTAAESLNALTAFANVPDMLKLFSDLFGGRYPFFNERYGFVRLPSLGWAMEMQTSVFLGCAIPANHSREILLAHETAHQWWGCSITPGSVKDVWLNEGFATYCEALYSDHWVDGLSYHDYMVSRMDFYLSLENNPLGHPYPMYDPPDGAVWTPTTYKKAASVLHMLRHIVGDSTFFDILRTYYQTYKYSNAVTSEFQEIAETVSGTDLDWFFSEWVYSAGHPEYDCRWNHDSLGPDSFRVNVFIDQVQSHDWDVPTFKMPIDIAVCHGDTSQFVVWDSLEHQAFELTVSGHPTALLFDPGDWILKEARVTGVEEGTQSTVHSPQSIVFPNPSTCDAGVHFRFWLSTVDRGPSTISIYDLGGRLVHTLNLYNLNESVQSVVWDARDFAPGVYFAVMKTGNQSVSRKLILMK
jgi:aminopeptidase N